MKYLGYKKLFEGSWALMTLTTGVHIHMGALSRFMNQYYPDVSSIMEMDISKVDEEWIRWLCLDGFKTIYITPNKDPRKEGYAGRSRTANFLLSAYDELRRLSDLRPEWIDLRGLERKHIEKYLLGINEYIENNLKRKNAYTLHYKKQCVSIIEKFLSDIQLWELLFAPAKSVSALIFPANKPSIGMERFRSVDYIPDFVLEQIFANIDRMNPKVAPAILIMFKTGLRISDVLALTFDCLTKLDGKYWLKTDIQKSGIVDHKIPIDDDLARLIQTLIIQTKAKISDASDKAVELGAADIPKDIMDHLWLNHKLNAIDTPFGTCLQRANGKCNFAKSPHCLTCNGGNPCKDLCVGAFEGNMGKYEILISSTSSLIEHAKQHGRDGMAQENEELLKLYQNIYNTISRGNMVYSRAERLREVNNEHI